MVLSVCSMQAIHFAILPFFTCGPKPQAMNESVLMNETITCATIEKYHRIPKTEKIRGTFRILWTMLLKVSFLVEFCNSTHVVLRCSNVAQAAHQTYTIEIIRMALCVTSEGGIGHSNIIYLYVGRHSQSSAWFCQCMYAGCVKMRASSMHRKHETYNKEEMRNCHKMAHKMDCLFILLLFDLIFITDTFSFVASTFFSL